MPADKLKQIETHVSRAPDRRVGVLAVTATLLATGWICLVGNVHLHEMILDVVVAGFSTAFCASMNRSETLPFKLRISDVAQGWRVPWYVLEKCTQITWVLIKDFAGQPASSVYRVCGFRGGLHDPAAIERMTLAIVYSTAAPNFIVIGIDPHQNHMLFHQIQRTSISKMTQALGAQR